MLPPFRPHKPAPVVTPCYDFGAGARSVAVYENRFGRLCRQEMAWSMVPGHLDPLRMTRMPWATAPAEEARDSRELRHAWRAQRCAVPVDAVFAFSHRGGSPQRYCIRRADSLPFFLAALWDLNDNSRRERQGLYASTRGFCLLTRKTTAEVAGLFRDMPIILSPAAVHPWASPATCESADIEQLLLPDKAEVVMYPMDNEARGAQLLIDCS